MLVLKFGGTSVGKPERMKKIADLVLSTPGQKVVVLSALSGTTNSLVTIGDQLLAGKPELAEKEIATLEKHYESFIKELYTTEAFLAIGQETVSRFFIFIRLIGCRAVRNWKEQPRIAGTRRELMSTELFYQHLQERKINSRLLASPSFYVDRRE
jgi:aspartate kinase